MKTFLKNYTSDVPVSETVHDIEKVLIRCGVLGITKEYDGFGGVNAIRFHIKPAPDIREITVRLPADKDKALSALWLDYADGEKLSPNGQEVWGNGRKRKKKKDFLEQAERTSWRIIYDWVCVQMSMIQLQQADTLEVFLPYVWDGQSGETFYRKLRNNGYRALLPEAV